MCSRAAVTAQSFHLIHAYASSKAQKEKEKKEICLTYTSASFVAVVLSAAKAELPLS